MRVKDLILQLQAFGDYDLPVMVDGYEGGIIEHFILKKVSVNMFENRDMAYYGEHEEDYWKDPNIPDHNVAILISRSV